jgi:Zn-dependent protease with chaperone function
MSPAGTLSVRNVVPDSLLAQVAAQARQRPALFRWRVRAVVLAGYGFVLGLFAVPVMVMVLAYLPLILRDSGLRLLLAILAGIVCVATIVMIRRPGAAAVAPRPPGIAVTRERAPELFAMIDSLCAKLALPAATELQITAELDASLLRDFGGGLFGRRRYTLFIGLPLMKCLTGPQLRAVLAHELGHAQGTLASRMTRIAQLEVQVRRLQEVFAKSTRPAARGLSRLAGRYLAQLHACALPLNRDAEYEADRTAVRLTSASELAQALVTTLVAGEYWRQVYWPHIYAQMRHISHPAFFPFTSFGAPHLTVLRAEQVHAWLEGPLGAKSAARALSPSLGERLRAIDAPAVWAPPPAGCAADELLGTERARLDAEYDEAWRCAVAPLWRRNYGAFNAPAGGAT